VTEHKFVILQGIEHGNVFYSTNSEHPELSAKGEVWYKILDYADTDEEAQEKLKKYW